MQETLDFLKEFGVRKLILLGAILFLIVGVAHAECFTVAQGDADMHKAGATVAYESKNGAVVDAIVKLVGQTKKADMVRIYRVAGSPIAAIVTYVKGCVTDPNGNAAPSMEQAALYMIPAEAVPDYVSQLNEIERRSKV